MLETVGIPFSWRVFVFYLHYLVNMHQALSQLFVHIDMNENGMQLGEIIGCFIGKVRKCHIQVQIILGCSIEPLKLL